jgi:hypothetical protein
MSDREGHSGVPGDDDLSLPKATVAKMISGTSFSYWRPTAVDRCLELLPNDIVCAKETRDLVIECCVGEVHTASSTASRPDPINFQNSST